ncbi:hypothetical protein [uncultured Paracoccus sp.]|uniref:hypothetical protein n=1 Tax=uncultured Paracoccus sp. TaxID=189685 RepID=UPI0026213589|nr:hypothetical protein [uncultured Paracoccus sp.]
MRDAEDHIQGRGWSALRKAKYSERTDDLFVVLTTEPNAEVRPGAMPVILTHPEDWETWMTAAVEIAGKL